MSLLQWQSVKGFTGAAQKLATSVAQISRRVANLEERLAVKLLNRTTRKVSLTEAGQLYYQQCKLLVEGLEIAELAVTQMQSTPKGLVESDGTRDLWRASTRPNTSSILKASSASRVRADAD